MSSLPTEIITDILSREPIKDLLRFRCVSKPWCTLIDGPGFIKLHLKRSNQTYSTKSLILRGLDKLYSLNLNSQNAVILDSPLHSTSNHTELLGSCNGLVCLSNTNDDNNNNDDVVLWNPSTRNHRILPVSPIRLSNYEFKIYGFGYDRANDDYKVLRIVQRFRMNDACLKSEVVIYSLKTHCWRKILDFPYELCYTREWGVFVNGALHYVAMAASNPEFTLIVAFDLDVESYRLVRHPERVENITHMILGLLEGCLCVLSTCPGTGSNIWVMKEYGVKESWTKLLCISPDIIGFASLRPLAFSKNGDAVLLERELGDGVKLTWYDLGRKKLKNAKFHGVPKAFEAMAFVESLVPLKGGDSEVGRKKRLEEPGEGKKKKKNDKKRDNFLSAGFKLVL